MVETRSRKLFVNLAIRDLKKSMDFFSQLGFAFNPKFTDENAPCMILSSEGYVMLLREPYFKSFTKRDTCDTTRQNEALLALSCDSRTEVDEMVKTAIANVGQLAMDPQDHGFMYGWSFYDIDATTGKCCGWIRQRLTEPAVLKPFSSPWRRDAETKPKNLRDPGDSAARH